MNLKHANTNLKEFFYPNTMLYKYKSDSYLCGELDKYAFKALIPLKINWIYQAKSDP